jgi:predicted Zn-ribbon and HTH transcriptional regulator
MPMTVRQKIMSEMEQGPVTARDLSKRIRISEKDATAHLEHVAQSLKPPRKLVIEPSVCNRCGFVFKNRRRFTSPSRCPECRHEGIRPPAFYITT